MAAPGRGDRMRDAFDALELKIYGLLSEEKPQAIVIEVLKVDKSKVSRTAKKLVDGEFLRIKVSKGVKIYAKGPKGNLLDDEIFKRSLSNCATSVRYFSPESFEKTILVHHMRCRIKVVTQGDLGKIVDEKDGRRLEYRFISEIKPLNGVRQWQGQIPYNDHWVTISMQVLAKSAWLYVYVPEVRLNAEDIRLRKHEEHAIGVSKNISNFICTRGGWELEQPEICSKWKPHFAYNHPALQGYSDKVYTSTVDGSSWLSDSNGATEVETCDLDIAQVMVELPGEVVKLKTQMRIMMKENDARIKENEARAKENETLRLLCMKLNADSEAIRAKLAELEENGENDMIPRHNRHGMDGLAEL